MSDDDTVIDLKGSTPSGEEPASVPRRGRKVKKPKRLKRKSASTHSDPDEPQERFVSLDERSYFSNYDAILNNKEESIVYVCSGSRAVYKSIEELEIILKNYSTSPESDSGRTEPLPAAWIDIQYPTVESMVLISRAFKIHTLTMEDCLSETEDQHQKNELFETYRFLSFSEYHYIPFTNVLGNVDIHIILPENAKLLISLHNGPALFIGSALKALTSSRNLLGLMDTEKAVAQQQLVQQQQAATSSTFLSRNSSGGAPSPPPNPFCLIPSSYWMMYVILDSIVDRFVNLVDASSMEIEQLDSLVLELSPREQADLLLRMGEARKQISLLRLQLIRKQDILQTITLEARDAAAAHDEFVHSTRIPVATSSEPSSPFISAASSSHIVSPIPVASPAPTYSSQTKKGIASIRIFLRDILDHINTMLVDLEQDKDTLLNLTNAYQARVSIEMSLMAAEQNKVMKKFGAMATIILPLTFIPSLWGMNVPVPGEKSSGTWAFWTIVGSLVAAGIIATIVFWRIRWLD